MTLASPLGVGADRALFERHLDGVMVSVHGQLESRYVDFQELLNPRRSWRSFGTSTLRPIFINLRGFWKRTSMNEVGVEDWALQPWVSVAAPGIGGSEP